MAKNLNNVNFDDLFTTPSAPTASEINQRAEAEAIGKKMKKRNHVSVLLKPDDFEYVREVCFERRISKNKFFEELLNEYRARH